MREKRRFEERRHSLAMGRQFEENSSWPMTFLIKPGKVKKFFFIQVGQRENFT